jgi:hypothetical protein
MARLMAQLEKVFGVSILVLLATAAAAQTQPDFSGRWTAPEPAAASGVRGVSIEPGTMGSGLGAEMTIEHRASRLTVERAQFSQYDMQPPLRFTYALDGSESRNIVNMGRGPQELVSKAAWQGASLVITTSHRFSNPQTGKTETGDVRQMLSLDASGSLVVTTTHGGVLGGPSSTSATTYRKN